MWIEARGQINMRTSGGDLALHDHYLDFSQCLRLLVPAAILLSSVRYFYRAKYYQLTQQIGITLRQPCHDKKKPRHSQMKQGRGALGLLKRLNEPQKQLALEN